MITRDADPENQATGIVGYHAYLPAYRLRRGEIAAAIGASARGVRCVAGYDEDSTTLAVAAALPVVRGREPTAGSVWFATTDPVYADKTNATVVHAALDLQPGILAADLGATVRSGIVALLAAARDGGLAVLADRRGGPVGGTDEREGADAAAAFLFGERDPLARIVGTASVTAEFIDRWRAPGAPDGGTWEERFGDAFKKACIDVARSLGRRRNRNMEAGVTDEGDDVVEVDAFDPGVELVDAAILARMAAPHHMSMLLEAIRNLPKRQSQAAFLAWVEGHPIEGKGEGTVVAIMGGIDPRAVYKHLEKARSTLTEIPELRAIWFGEV